MPEWIKSDSDSVVRNIFSFLSRFMRHAVDINLINMIEKLTHVLYDEVTIVDISQLSTQTFIQVLYSRLCDHVQKNAQHFLQFLNFENAQNEMLIE